MRINSNTIAMNAYRSYTNAFIRMQQSLERLSTGLRINRAADDPAGLAISEKMRAQIRGLRMASKNSQDAISLVATAEGALQETQNILQRMRELAVQSASDTNETSIDRAALNAEFQHLLKEIDDTAKRTVFNDQPLLDGTYGTTSEGIFSQLHDDIYARFYPDSDMRNGNYTLSVDGSGAFTIKSQDGTFTATSKPVDFSKPYDARNPIVLSFSDGSTMSFKLERGAEITDMDELKELLFGGTANDSVAFQHVNRGMTIQTGPNQGDELRISINAMNSTVLGLQGANVSTRDAASGAIGRLDRALNTVSSQRSQLGALQNRLEHKINNLENTAQNLADAESRIRDVDFAEEMSNFVRNQILMQAATAMLAQANTMGKNVLKLLGM